MSITIRFITAMLTTGRIGCGRARGGRERALQIWREFPILDYGKKWDVD